MPLASFLFVWQPGCDECTRHKPWVAQFRDRNPAIKVVETDYTKEEEHWPSRWRPEEIPCFVVFRPGKAPRAIYGGFEGYDDMSKWVLDRCFGDPPVGS